MFTFHPRDTTECHILQMSGEFLLFSDLNGKDLEERTHGTGLWFTSPEESLSGLGR